MSKFLSDEQRDTIKAAIEDHSSSLEDIPRSKYGELVSSADRNTKIEIVFIRSFFVAHARMPEMQIDEYLDYTYSLQHQAIYYYLLVDRLYRLQIHLFHLYCSV